MTRRLIGVFAGMLCCAAALHAQTPAKPAPSEKGGAYVPVLPTRPQGVYAAIDLRPMNEALRILDTAGQRTHEAREVVVGWVAQQRGVCKARHGVPEPACASITAATQPGPPHWLGAQRL